MYFYHRTRDNWVEKFGEDGFDFSLFEFRKRIIGRCDVSRCVPGFKAIAERWTKTFLPCKFRPYRLTVFFPSSTSSLTRITTSSLPIYVTRLLLHRLQPLPALPATSSRLNNEIVFLRLSI